MMIFFINLQHFNLAIFELLTVYTFCNQLLLELSVYPTVYVTDWKKFGADFLQI